MKAALRAVGPKSKAVRKKATASTTIRLDAKTWRRLETAAKNLSKVLGHDVTVEALIVASAEAVAAVSKVAAKTKKR